MAFIKLQFKPGVNRDQTNYSNEGGWYECDKIRFFSGYPQKIGGWAQYNTFNGDTSIPQKLIGTCRQMFNWVTTFGDNIMAYGTNSKFYLEVGGNLYDITPLRYTSTAGDTTFLATEGSSTIVVSDVANGCVAGDFVTFVDATSLGGNITADVLNQNYQIESVIDANTYTISAKDTSGNAVTASASDVESDTFTANSGTGVITFSTYTPTNGDRFYLYNTDGALPSGLSEGTVYYAIDSSSTTCKLSTTDGGSAVTLTTNGTGTQTASVFGGGSGAYGEYEITVGNAASAYGYGWGTSTWSRGTWGSGSTVPVVLPQASWTMTNFDNDLVLNIKDGAIYYWTRGGSTDPSSALNTRATLLSSESGASAVPYLASQILVSQNDKHLLAFGCTPYGGGSTDFDPLLIRWANQDDPAYWTPEVTNSSGDIRVSRGSYIVQALPTRQEILVWTDSTLNSLQFLGTTDVFGLQELADNISIISPRAAISANNITYWMGQDKFYVYSGTVNTMACTLRHHVFSNLNYDQTDQIIAATNEGFSEIWWFYPSGTSTVPNSYVIFNYLENIWYYGTMTRTAWLDTPLRQYPQSVGTDGTVYNQEYGVDDNGSPMEAYIQSSDFDISDGENLMLTRRMIPDLDFTGSAASNATPTAYITLSPKLFPGSVPGSEPNLNVIQTSANVFTNQVFIRARGRTVAFKVGSTDLGVQWQLGSTRLDARPDGKR